MMRMTKPTIGALALAFAGSIGASHAQTRAAACFFANDFQGENALNGWDLGPAVERRTPEGEGLGEFVPAWTVGNAADANAEGYFPVVDSPAGNRFAMANDAAAPCNCDMGDVALTTPAIDLSGRVGVALECRVFNEGLFGAGPAVIEASVANGEWTLLHTLPDLAGVWQAVSVDLGGFDGSTDLRLRFRWSDGGAWAGGFAVDDVCLRERNTFDMVVSDAQLGANSASPYTTGDQRMYHRQLPLSQAAPVTIAATVKNGGTAALHQVRMTGTITLNGTEHGPFTSAPIAELLPGASVEVAIATGWLPDGVGHATITITGAADEADEAPEDDVATGSVQFTGPLPDDGYSAMSCDAGVVTGSVGGSEGFIAFNRLEIAHNGDHARGISVQYTDRTEAGAIIRAILMDANFNMLDTSARRALQQADIDAIQNGTPIHEAFSHTVALTPGDHHVGLQLLSGGEQGVHIAVGGATPAGRSGIMEGLGFTITTLHSAPMVRLHLAEVPVGLEEASPRHEQLAVYPNPADRYLVVDVPMAAAPGHWTLTDMPGRTFSTGTLSAASGGRLTVDISGLPAGAYILSLHTRDARRTARFIVAHD